TGFVFYFLSASDILVNYGFEFYPLGFIAILLALGVWAYAIVRHQFMDIEVIVKRTLVFAGLVGSVVVVVSLMAFLSQEVLIRVVAIPRWLSNVFAAAIIAGVYGPLRNWLTNATERYLFQKKYDYKALLKRFTDEVMLKVDLKQLLETTVKTLTDVVKLDGCSLLLLNKDTRTYELAAASEGANPSTRSTMSRNGLAQDSVQAISAGLRGHPLALEEVEPFITFLRRTHEPIGSDGSFGKVRFPAAVTDCLAHLHARLALPLAVHDDLIGVLCLGKKKSDEEFTKDDLDILLPLARTLAIAVSNAQLFDELAKTQAEAAQKEKLAVIGTLSAGINHEICNPLGIVKAQCEAFLIDQEDGILIGKPSQDVLERSTTIMRVALKQIDRATAITQKLSNFAKPIKEPTSQPVVVAQEVDEVLLLVGHDLALEKIEVVKEIQPDLPPILVDRRQLQEVLFNLIRNAGQAITPPGTITVRAQEHDGQVRIAIADTGSGIAPDKLEKIYDPFFTTKEPGKGTGLGLFIVRQIIERNKGRISVESAVGQGTTFLLEFPIARPQLQPTTAMA
ncbi:MAG: ATP-binding protein, partial [Candidatus Omnitrophota bacterium]|nr:ATP-binding protein [Candidatus Omnitrophota bacterium]